MTERRCEEVFIISARWQHEQFLSTFFTNSQRPVVECLTIAAGILARSEGVFKGTGADKRFVKKVLKNAECHLADMINTSSHLLFATCIKDYFKSNPLCVTMFQSIELEKRRHLAWNRNYY